MRKAFILARYLAITAFALIGLESFGFLEGDFTAAASCLNVFASGLLLRAPWHERS